MNYLKEEIKIKLEPSKSIDHKKWKPHQKIKSRFSKETINEGKYL